MLRADDRSQQHLFDPWQFMSPKRRENLEKGWPGFFREQIFDLLPVDQFAIVFSRHFGRPTKDLYTVLGVLALQQYFDLDDEQAVSQLSYNIQWHYALGIVEESDDAKYMSPKTLWTMRTLATELGLEQDWFDETARKIAELYNVDPSHQRLDSVHIRSNMARLGRIGIFVKAIKRFLVNLKRQHRGLFDQLDSQLVQRYLSKQAGQYFAGVKPSESKKTLTDVASDLYWLVQWFDGHKQVASMSSYKLLERIVAEQCHVQSDGTIEAKAPKEVSSDSLQNPSDPDATYSGHKGQGYQVQVMETYDPHQDGEKDPTRMNLITCVQIEKACQSDAQALLPMLEESIEKQLEPEAVETDALYGSDENCQEAEAMGIEVISPAMGTEKRAGGNLSDFNFLPDGHIDTCPTGHSPDRRKRTKNGFSEGFDVQVCEKCPLAQGCRAKRGKKRFYVSYSRKALRIAKRRQYEQTDEFREQYRFRAGVEATMSQYDRLTGVKHLRVRGFKAVRFAAIMKAAAVNIARAVAVRKARAMEKARRMASKPGKLIPFQVVKERLGLSSPENCYRLAA